jgi:hypothetical protein
MWKANARETGDAHVGVREFQDALGEENQSDGKTNEKEAGWAGRGLKQEAERRVHKVGEERFLTSQTPFGMTNGVKHH